MADIGQRRDLYNRMRTEALQAKSDQADRDLERKVNDEVLPAMNAYVTSLNALAAFHKKELVQLGPRLEADSTRSRGILIALLTVSVLISVSAG